MLFNEAIDTIVEEAMQQYAATSTDDTPQSMSILISAPKVLGVTVMPPIIINIGMVNTGGCTYALFLGWYVWQLPADDLPDVLSKLISLEELLNEYYEDEEDNEDQQNPKT